MPTRPNDSSPAFVSKIQQALTELRQAIEEELRARADSADPEVRAAAQKSDRESLRAALQVIDSASGRAEILSRLLEQASLFAERVGLFQVHGDRLKGWSVIGFGAKDSDLRELEVSLVGPWSEVVQSGGAAHLEGEAVAEACRALACPPGRRALLVPFVLRGRVEAVLYADQVSSESAIAHDELQILCHCAAQTLDLAPLREGSASALRSSDDDSDPVPPHPTQAAPPVAAAVAVSDPPEVAPSAPESRLYTAPEEPSPPPEAPSEALEAAPSAEVPSADPNDGPVGSGQVAPPSDLQGPGSAFDTGLLATSDPGLTSPDKARRLAAFLVSEIKLYNKERLTKAREAGDIYSHFEDDIELARSIYNERIEPGVGDSAAYFDDEILRVLADGDLSLLGR